MSKHTQADGPSQIAVRLLRLHVLILTLNPQLSTLPMQPVAGVAPTQLQEVTVMVVWPSLSATAFGRLWGRLFAIEAGFRVFGVPLTLGRLFALASIPFMVALYFLMRLPRFPGVVIGIRN